MAAISSPSYAQESTTDCGVANSSALIWCESFETGASLEELFFDLSSGDDDLLIAKTNSAHGDYSLQANWDPSEIDAGGFIVTFGKSPLQSQTHALDEFREIYWRVFVRLDAGFTGQPDKLTRVTIFANDNWAQAMIGHVWTAGADELAVDPASGIDEGGNLITTKWNDFDNLRWLGLERGNAKFSANTWHCIESHVRLNDASEDNGVFEFWFDGVLQARQEHLNWVGSWDDFGLNAVTFSNYWNAGSPSKQSRYFDSLVISTERIGCAISNSHSRPSPPSNLKATD